MTNPNESNEQALIEFGNTVRYWVSAVSADSSRGQAAILEIESAAKRYAAQASLATPQPQTVRDALEEAGDLCAQQRDRAARDYGIAESVGADMCHKAILALIEPLSAADSVAGLEKQLLLDAQEAGFTVINGLIYSPSACERMEALKAFAIIRENRAIAPLVQELDKAKKDLEYLCQFTYNGIDLIELKKDAERYRYLMRFCTNLEDANKQIDSNMAIEAAINKE